MFESTFNKIIMTCVGLMLFSYVEYSFDCGLIISAILSLILVVRNGSWISPVVLATQYALSEFEYKQYSCFLFLVLEFIFIFFDTYEDRAEFSSQNVEGNFCSREEELCRYLQHLQVGDDEVEDGCEVRGITMKDNLHKKVQVTDKSHKIDRSSKKVSRKFHSNSEKCKTYIEIQSTTTTTFRRIRSPNCSSVRVGEKSETSNVIDIVGMQTFQSFKKNQIVKRIRYILKEHSPVMHQFVDRMLHEYCGRESELLTALNNELRIAASIKDFSSDGTGDQSDGCVYQTSNSRYQADHDGNYNVDDHCFNYRNNSDKESSSKHSNFDIISSTNRRDRYDNNYQNASSHMHNTGFNLFPQGDIHGGHDKILQDGKVKNIHHSDKHKFSTETLDFPRSTPLGMSTLSIGS